MRLSLSARLYIGLISLFALLIVAGIIPEIFAQLRNLYFVQAILIFWALGALADIFEVKLAYSRNTSTATSVYLASIILGGMPFSVAVTFVSTLFAEILLRRERLSEDFMRFIYAVAFNLSQCILSIVLAASVFTLLGGQSLDFSQGKVISHNQVIPALGAFVAYALVNNLLVAGIITLTERTTLLYHLGFNLKYLLIPLLSLGVLGILIAVLFAQSPWYLLLVVIPLGLVHVSVRNYMKLRHQAQKTFERVSHLLSDRDPYTYEHSSQVADLAEQIARKLKLNQDHIEQIRSAAVIHDIGKLGVPDRILQKPGSLTEDEWVIMKKHPEIGADLLKDLEIDAYIIDVVRHEHERWDGSGYPKGLKGEEIPIGARIVAVADVYSALTTDRPYRPAYSQDIALNMLRDMSEVKLDAHVVDALCGMLEDASAQPVHTPTKVGVL